MPSNLEKLVARGLAKPPHNLGAQLQYETWMGSAAYGVSADNSDLDVYGFAIPDKAYVFPHQVNAEIEGYDLKGPRFEQYEQAHIDDGRTVWDFQIYNITKYFRLLKGCNPNLIDSLFTPIRCVTHMTPIGQKVRERRHKFLHKGAWHTFKGYSYSQMVSIKKKVPKEGSKRYADYLKYGFDVKFAYHVVRLLGEVEQILTEGDLDLERNREQLKSIRRGEWTLEDIEKYFTSKERELETVYNNSKLPYTADDIFVKGLLMECLEDHFGNLSNVVIDMTKDRSALLDIRTILERVGV